LPRRGSEEGLASDDRWSSFFGLLQKPCLRGGEACVAYLIQLNFQTVVETDTFFAAGYLAIDHVRTFCGENHSDDWRHLDVVAIKCDGATKVGGRVLRSRP